MRCKRPRNVTSAMNGSNRVTAPRLAARTAGTGPTLVLFHGGMGSWNHWIRNLDALAARFTVHAVDLPGYGDSFAVSKSIAKQEYIDHVVGGLRPIVNEAPFSLAGFSLGGVIAAMAAARLGAQIHKLSLLGVGGFGPAPALPMRAIPPASGGVAARREVFRHNLRTLMLADPASVTDEALDLHTQNFNRTRYDGRGHANSEFTALSLPRITSAIQFIYGAKDALNEHVLEERRSHVRCLRPDAEFVVVPGAGHWVQYEAAEAVNRRLLAFLGN
jgi:2-hydroxy-6-oxonona-2,4-dienedioate hydrolase